MTRLLGRLSDAVLSVPVRIKIFGIILLPVLVLGLSLIYWVQSGLSDWLSYLLSSERVHVAMEAGGRGVLFVTFLTAVLAVFLTYLLMVALTHPLLELRDAARRVIRGDLTSRSRVFSDDEIGEVASSVNQMIDHLLTVQIDLERSNRRLEAMNRIAMTANLEQEIHDILFRIIGIILDVFDLETGWIYLYDPERLQFHLATWRGVPEAHQPALVRPAGPSPCTCQQAFLENDPNASIRIQHCRRLEEAAQSGREAAHLSLPLEARDQKFGIVNLRCNPDKQISDEDLELLKLLAAQVSEIVANAWLHLKLTEKEAARQALLSALVQAQEDERGRISRELHDEAGQMLTSLLVRLKILENRLPQADFKNTLADLCETTSETIEYLRGLSHRLRPIVLEEFRLEIALRMLASDIQNQSELAIDLDSNLGEKTFPVEVETVIYRIVQEALTNVIRHARARRVRIAIRAGGSSLSLRVEDDGIGFDPEFVDVSDGRQRLGLLGMKERSELLGGRFDVYSAPGQGTVIELDLPLYEKVPV